MIRLMDTGVTLPSYGVSKDEWIKAMSDALMQRMAIDNGAFLAKVLSKDEWTSLPHNKQGGMLYGRSNNVKEFPDYRKYISGAEDDTIEYLLVVDYGVPEARAKSTGKLVKDGFFESDPYLASTDALSCWQMKHQMVELIESRLAELWRYTTDTTHNETNGAPWRKIWAERGVAAPTTQQLDALAEKGVKIEFFSEAPLGEQSKKSTASTASSDAAPAGAPASWDPDAEAEQWRARVQASAEQAAPQIEVPQQAVETAQPVAPQQTAQVAQPAETEPPTPEQQGSDDQDSSEPAYSMLGERTLEPIFEGDDNWLEYVACTLLSACLVEFTDQVESGMSPEEFANLEKDEYGWVYPNSIQVLENLPSYEYFKGEALFLLDLYIAARNREALGISKEDISIENFDIIEKLRNSGVDEEIVARMENTAYEMFHLLMVGEEGKLSVFETVFNKELESFLSS